MAHRSLHVELLAWVVTPLALFASVSTFVAYRNAEETATVMQDRMLLGSARIIAQQVRYDDGVLQVVIPPAALEMFKSDDHDRVYYRITDPKAALLAGYAELPPPPTVDVGTPAFFETVFRGAPVRIGVFAQPVFAAPSEGPVIIEVGQTLQSRKSLANEIWKHWVVEQLSMLVLVGLLTWVGLRRGLAPLLELRDKVRQRDPSVLEPLDSERVPIELVPVVDALNHYVQKLDEHVSAHSRFIANAAHQLRTPLTLLNTQATYALRRTDLQGKDHALRAIHDSLGQSIRMVHQLLTLSVAESLAKRDGHPSTIDLAELVPGVLETEAALAESKNIDLGFEHVGGPATVFASQAMLRELVANLVDNALRYTPAGGIVTASVIASETEVELRLEDNGPGIPREERDRVFERFCRLREDECDGCGLGLSIVREIAAAWGARVTLSEPRSGKGVLATVTFAKYLPASSNHAVEHPVGVTARA